MFDLSSRKYPIRSLFKAKLELLRFKQGRGMSVIDYHKKFNELVGVYEYGKGMLGRDKAILTVVDDECQEVIDAEPGPPPVEPQLPDTTDLERVDTFTYVFVEGMQATFSAYIETMRLYSQSYNRWLERKGRYDSIRHQAGRDFFLGMLLIENACPHRFGSLTRRYIFPLPYQHRRSFTLPDRSYPHSTPPPPGSNRNNGGGKGGRNNSRASQGGNNRDRNNEPRFRRGANTDMNFLQTDSPVAGTDGRLLPDVTCWNCLLSGHYQG